MENLLTKTQTTLKIAQDNATIIGDKVWVYFNNKMKGAKKSSTAENLRIIKDKVKEKLNEKGGVKESVVTRTQKVIEVIQNVPITRAIIMQSKRGINAVKRVVNKNVVFSDDGEIVSDVSQNISQNEQQFGQATQAAKAAQSATAETLGTISTIKVV
tara:strand:- start:2809 stop:3279 length:471 start_codon:yes stop_codon:yes gene_type:complete